MPHELIDRYIYAVTRRLPLKQRADVEKELASLISDMLEARCGDITPSEKDIRVALTELGSPEELAAKYSGDEGRALISGSYFAIYKMVLKIVLPIAAAGIAFAGVLSLITDGNPEANPFIYFGKLIGGAAGGLIQAFAVITVIFAIFEWKKVSFHDGDFISSLPQVPTAGARIKRHDAILGIALSVVAAAVFIGVPQIAGFWMEDTGWLPLFNVRMIRSFWPLIVLWAVLGAAKEIMKLIEGHYTRRLAIVTVAVDLLIAAGTVYVFSHSAIINPVFAPRIVNLFAGESAVIPAFFSHFNLFFMGLVLFALVLEMVTVAVKAWKNGAMER